MNHLIMQSNGHSVLKAASVWGATAMLFSSIFASPDAMAIMLYNDRNSFLAESSATPNTPIPHSGGLVTTLSLDQLTITTPSPSFSSDSYSVRLPGNVISVSGIEDLNIDFGSPVYSYGFDFHEPQLDFGTFAPPIDSTFSVQLLEGGLPIGSFIYNAPDDTAAFVGVWSDTMFDRIEIREISGGIDNEFFGQSYSGSVALPESVPGPLPILIMPAALRLSRKLRTRINSSKQRVSISL